MATQTAEPDTVTITDEELEEAIEGNFPCGVAPSILVLRRWFLMLYRCKRPAMWIGKLSCCGARYYFCDKHKKGFHRVKCAACGQFIGASGIAFRPLG